MRTNKMKAKLKMVYWKGEKFWVGKLVDHPEIMTQGETLEELEENIIDAYRLVVFDDVPTEHETKEVVLIV
jgi:predicted RNase H-like HicB family nuclease